MNKIIKGSALDVLRTLEPNSRDLCITSPPYFRQRSYGTPTIWDADPGCVHDWQPREFKLHAGRGDAQKSGKFSEQEAIPDRVLNDAVCSKCQGWLGELGLEATPAKYLDHLIQIFAEVKRVLKPTGSCWVNMGDSYGGSGGAGGDYNKGGNREGQPRFPGTGKAKTPEKSLLQIPARFSIRMTDELGFTLRNEIIWHKRNAMPSSAKDRFTIDFEPIYFYVKNPRKYYFNTQYEPYVQSSDTIRKKIKGGLKAARFGGKKAAGYDSPTYSGKPWNPASFGRIKRTVWDVTTRSYGGKHYATYPEPLVEIPITASCPSQICKLCGHMPQTTHDQTFIPTRPARNVNTAKSGHAGDPNKSLHKSHWSTSKPIVVRTESGRTKCACNAGYEPGTLIDPFFGAGTTGVVALKLGRRFLGIELSDDYIAQAQARLAPLLEQSKLTDFKAC